MSLIVPHVAQGTGVTVADNTRLRAALVANAGGASTATAQTQLGDELDIIHNVKYDPSRQEAIFAEKTNSPVRNGDWIILNGKLHTIVILSKANDLQIPNTFVS